MVFPASRSSGLTHEITNTVCPCSTAHLMNEFLGRKIQDVVLVDPRRNDEERSLAYGLRRRRVLQELHQVVLEDNLAGSDGDIHPELELFGIGHSDPKLPLSPFQILEHVGEPLHEVLSTRLDGAPGHLGIRGRKVRRCEGVDELAGVEVHLVSGMRVESFRFAHRGEHELRREQVALLDVVVERVLRPGVVLEPAVSGVGRHRRLDLLPGHAPSRVLPQPRIVLPQRDLGFDQAPGIGQHLLPQRLVCLRHHRGFERIELAGGARLAFDERLHDAPAPIGDAIQRRVQALRVRIGGSRGRLLAHGMDPPCGCVDMRAPNAGETIPGDAPRAPRISRPVAGGDGRVSPR